VAAVGLVLTTLFGLLLGGDWGDCSTQPDPVACRRKEPTDVFIKPFNVLLLSSAAQLLLVIVVSWNCCCQFLSNEDAAVDVDASQLASNHGIPMASGARAAAAYEYNQIPTGSEAFVQINHAY
jgi:hypothetical protein